MCKLNLRILTGKWYPQIKLQSSQKVWIWNLVSWHIKPTLYKRLLNWKKIKKKKSSYWQISVLCDTFILHPPSPIRFVLKLTCDRAVLHVAFLILVLSTEKQNPSFLKKVLAFQKICFKVRILKTFKITNGCHLKACQSLKRRAILKITCTVFLEEPMLFLLALE